MTYILLDFKVIFQVHSCCFVCRIFEESHMDISCNTEKDKQRSHHRTAGMHIYIYTYLLLK